MYSAPIIANNFFINNTSKVTGSGIMASGNSTGWIINNVFQDNKLTQTTGYGAVLGIYSDPVIANNIISGNGGNGIWVQPQAFPTIHNNNVWNCALDSYAGSVTDQNGINGNIALEPQIGPALLEPFTSYELHPNSPCIDTGSNLHLPPTLIDDYDGSERVVTGTVDIGPQEYHMIAVPKDHPTIQQAINMANTGDEIIVLPGFYQENLNFLGKNLTLRSLNPLDVNCVENTILDGNDLASCITLESGEDKSSIIAGLNIQDGNGEFGGGIYIADNGGCTILYNYIHDNHADRYGGAIDTRHLTDTVIEYNRLEYNHANNAGGGVHIGANAECRIFKNYIAYNETNFARQGGGIYSYNYSDVYIIENEICHNWSSSGGGIYTWKTNGSIERNHIWDNYASAIGGGIALHPNWQEPYTITYIVNNLIEGNMTGLSGRGGGIYLLQGKTAVINNTITENTASAQSGSGIALEAGAYADIANNIIADNLGGSGIHLDMPGDPNNLIEPNCVANDLWNNQGGEYSGELNDQNGINGNISSDPCFAYIGYREDNNTPDPNDDYFIRGNYRITYFSTCRDMGDSNYAPITDLNGNNRPYFDEVDIGAYELQGYDMSGTGMVDYTDIALLAASWLDTEGSLLMDLDGSGIVDGSDFALLAQGWMR
ncbi:MAG: right-handed parallel beta-helix repeat-containing protein [Planctomycetota bacterium]